MAMTAPDPESMAMADGSSSTMPRPATQMSVLTVPRSIATLPRMRIIAHLISPPDAPCAGCAGIRVLSLPARLRALVADAFPRRSAQTASLLSPGTGAPFGSRGGRVGHPGALGIYCAWSTVNTVEYLRNVRTNGLVLTFYSVNARCDRKVRGLHLLPKPG